MTLKYDQLDARAVALAIHTGCDLTEIEMKYGEHHFVIGEHTVKEGDPPEKFVKHAAALHAFLAERGLDQKTWQDLNTNWSYTTLQVACVGNSGNYPQVDGEIHYYSNGFYHLIGGKLVDADKWHVYALRAAFNGEPIEDRRENGLRDQGEYSVLTDNEADEAAKDSFEDFCKSDIVSQIPENLQGYFDTDKFVEDAMSTDGRASTLASYDGEENEINLNNHENEINEMFCNLFEVPAETTEELNTLEQFIFDETLICDWEELTETYYIYRTN